MDHQNSLKYLALLEIICCQSFSFEECFSCFVKPHHTFIETEQATEGKDKERDKMKKREKMNRWRKEIELRKEILNY